MNTTPLLPASAPCPFCDGLETDLMNPFGGQLSVAQYWCRKCRTAFEFVKWGKERQF
ncbi:MAG TPA: hypothetical protein VFI91_10370 [Longimicrobiaceae bacterium]|nr:hypothetical protein [Longimicrobiaceae bacterium]